MAGVEGDLRTNAEQYLTDQPPCDASAADVRAYADTLPERVRSALQAFGYYRGVATATVEQAERADCWRITLHIDPGAPVTIEQVVLELRGEARDDARFRSLFDMFPLVRDGVLRHRDYLAFKSRVESLASERGYREGHFTRERIDVYVDRSRATIELAYDSGPRYRFGDVTFSSEPLAPRVLHSFVGFETNDPYDATLVVELQRDLLASEYFADVRVTPDLDEARDGRIPVRVALEAANPVSYSVGFGFSTDDGPRLRFLYENSRRNRAGHRLTGDVLVSQVRRYATAEYRIPRGNPQRDWLSPRAALAREDVDAGIGAAARLGVQRTSVRDALTVMRYVDLLFENDEIAGEDLYSRLVVPGISLTRTRRDDLARPRHGHRLSLALSAGLGEGTPFVDLDAGGKWIRALPWNARLLLRGRVGALLDRGRLDRVPLSMRFFAGGDNSIRGFDYESLGPRNEAGELIGGNRLLEASVEYEQSLRPTWALAVFVDAGNAFLDGDLTVERSVGIGGRWFSPIGPVRVDVAWPISAADHSPRLHISLGPDL
ncbi:MAG TPA: autotransporter assembly complex family protein [Gammaproteobacteria bacterium]